MPNVFLGPLVRAIRTRRGLTMERLAYRCGVSFTTVEHWEQGRKVPGSNNLNRLAAELGVEMAEFFGPAEAVTP